MAELWSKCWHVLWEISRMNWWTWKKCQLPAIIIERKTLHYMHSLNHFISHEWCGRKVLMVCFVEDRGCRVDCRNALTQLPNPRRYTLHHPTVSAPDFFDWCWLGEIDWWLSEAELGLSSLEAWTLGMYTNFTSLMLVCLTWRRRVTIRMRWCFGNLRREPHRRKEPEFGAGHWGGHRQISSHGALVEKL